MDEERTLTPTLTNSTTALHSTVRLTPPATEPFIPPLTILESASFSIKRLATELYTHRELLGFLAWRDVKVRYQQTALGVLWALLQPLLTMLVFALFLGRVAGLVAAPTIPYSLFLLSGLVPWMFFANALISSSQSIVGSQQLITKVYFPRLAIPLSAVLACGVDFVIMMILLLGFTFFYGVLLTWTSLLLPLCMLGIMATAAGMGTWLSALTVAYRDFRFIIPFMVQIGMFLTPVVYGWEQMPSPWKWFLLVNPMTGWVEAFRACLFESWNWRVSGMLATSIVLTAGLNLSSWYYFQRVERRFADVI